MKRTVGAALRRVVAAAIQYGLHIPLGLRWLAGLVFVACGLVGFLPILGFWMIPAGIVLVALDVPPWRDRLVAWAERKKPV